MQRTEPLVSESRGEYVSAWVAFARENGFVATSSVTLTSAKDVEPETMWRWWAQLLRYLNTRRLGENYKRMVKHSYLGYIVAQERQKRGCPHIHAVIDGHFDFEALHRFWKVHGFAWVEVVRDNDAAIVYAIKYAIKEGAPRFWFARFTDRRGPMSHPTCAATGNLLEGDPAGGSGPGQGTAAALPYCSGQG